MCVLHLRSLSFVYLTMCFEIRVLHSLHDIRRDSSSNELIPSFSVVSDDSSGTDGWFEGATEWEEGVMGHNEKESGMEESSMEGLALVHERIEMVRTKMQQEEAQQEMLRQEASLLQQDCHLQEIDTQEIKGGSFTHSDGLPSHVHTNKLANVHVRTTLQSRLESAVNLAERLCVHAQNERRGEIDWGRKKEREYEQEREEHVITNDGRDNHDSHLPPNSPHAAPPFPLTLSTSQSAASANASPTQKPGLGCVEEGVWEGDMVRAGKTGGGNSQKKRNRTTVGLLLRGRVIYSSIATVIGAPSNEHWQVKKGDLILKVNGQTVTKDSVANALTGSDVVGSRLDLELKRHEASEHVLVSLTRMPASKIINHRIKLHNMLLAARQDGIVDFYNAIMAVESEESCHLSNRNCKLMQLASEAVRMYFASLLNVSMRISLSTRYQFFLNKLEVVTAQII